MAPLRMLYTVILFYIFKVNNFLNDSFSETVRASAKMRNMMFADSGIPIEMHECEYCTFQP